MESCGRRPAGSGLCPGAPAAAGFGKRPSGARCAFYTTALAALALLLAGSAACSRGPSRPSVLIVVMQNVRADHTSVGGYPKQTTPALEAIAAEGGSFQAAYASSPSTAAALASLLTGRYPPEHGLLLRPQLDPAAQTIAEFLQEQGYATHAVVSDPSVTRETGVLQGFQGIDTVDPGEAAEADGGAAETTRRALRWLKEDRDTSKPWFLLVLYSSPQLPFNPPQDYRFKFADPGSGAHSADIVSSYWLPFAKRFTSKAIDMSGTESIILRGLYDGEIGYLDSQVRLVIGSLRDARTLDDTVVVVTSDHGEDLGEHHRLADPSSLTDGSLRVPLLFRYPKSIPAGTKVAGLAQDVDVFPTICGLLGIKTPTSVSAIAASHVPFDGSARRRAAVSVALEAGGGNQVDLILSVRDARYRYELTPQGPRALFDLSTDALESMNVLEKQTEAAAKLQADLQTWDAKLRPLTGSLPKPGQALPGEPSGASPAAAAPSGASGAPQTPAGAGGGNGGSGEAPKPSTSGGKP